MAVTLQALSSFLRVVYEANLKVEEEGVDYLIVDGDYGVRVLLYPEDFCNELISLEMVNIQQLFCFKDGSPLNVSNLVASDRSDHLSLIYDIAFWGKPRVDRVDDELIIINHDRWEPLALNDLDCTDQNDFSDGAVRFMTTLNCMIEEWRQMNNLVVLLTDHPGSEQEIEEKIKLFAGGYEGRS